MTKLIFCELSSKKRGYDNSHVIVYIICNIINECENE